MMEQGLVWDPGVMLSWDRSGVTAWAIEGSRFERSFCLLDYSKHGGLVMLQRAQSAGFGQPMKTERKETWRKGRVSLALRKIIDSMVAQARNRGTFVYATYSPQVPVPPQRTSTSPYPNHDTFPSHADSRHSERPRADIPNEIQGLNICTSHKFAYAIALVPAGNR